MSSDVRWGILGTGWMAREISRAIPRVAGARLVGVASREASKAAAFARDHGIPSSYGDYQQLVEDAAIDVIYVATPNHRHRDDCLRAIAAGKAVVCEKPFCLNEAEGQRVVAAARRQAVFCMEAMWMRFIPMVIEARRRVQAGELGSRLILQADFGYPATFDPQSRLFQRQLGGGCLLDRGVYPISLAHFFFGEPDDVEGMAVLGTTGVDEHSAYLLGYRDGTMAILAATLTGLGSNEASIAGNRGRLRLMAPFYATKRLTITRTPNESCGTGIPSLPRRYMARLYRRLKPHSTVRRGFPGSGYQFQVAEVTRCLREGRLESPLMPLDESLAVLRTMDRLRRKWGLVYPQEEPR